MLSQQDIAEHLDLSQSAVSQWLDRIGIDHKAVTLDYIRVAYIRSLREQAAGRATLGDLDLATERAGLAKAQRERIEMQNAVTRRELAPVMLIEEVMAKAGSKVAAILAAIPGMLKRRGMASTDVEIVSAEIASAQNLAAAITLDDLYQEEEAA